MKRKAFSSEKTFERLSNFDLSERRGMRSTFFGKKGGAKKLPRNLFVGVAVISNKTVWIVI